MKKIMVLFFIHMITTASFAEDIGAVAIGINNYLSPSSAYDAIESRGLAVGVMVPVNFQRPVHLKLKAAFHNVDAKKIGESEPSYLQFSNEILVGSKWIKQGPLGILPQIGLGFVAERFRIAKGDGGSHGDFFIDLSCRFDVELPDFNLGILINFERDFNIGYGSFLSPNRLNAALVLSR